MEVYLLLHRFILVSGLILETLAKLIFKQQQSLWMVFVFLIVLSIFSVFTDP